jgi:alkane 1-monooxygenase
LDLGYLLTLILPMGAVYFAGKTGNHNRYGWYLLAVYLFVAGIDHYIGPRWFDTTNERQRLPRSGKFHSILLYLSIPAALVLTASSAYYFSNTAELNLAGRIGWIISLGLAIAGLILSAGHELVHREARLDKISGDFLFALVCNSAHKIEHIRGHHMHVATRADSGFAGLNQSFYRYLPNSILRTFKNAWLAEKKRLNCMGRSAICARNELIIWYLISLGIAAIYYFCFGLPGIIFYMCQGLVALVGHHLINYIQHYGLERRKLDSGRYEKFTASNAWDCNFLISNVVSFYLPRHTDHHINPRCPYQLRQPTSESPQMPMGFSTTFFLALVPPLWFRVMNPRILEINKEAKSKHSLSSSPG